MTDPIADMFTRIRNASIIGKPEILLPMSKLKLEIAKILANEGWVKKVEVVAGGLNGRHSNFDQLRIELKYQKNGKPQITSIQRTSKPGLRVYVGKNDIPTVRHNFGFAIISTSRGMMTNKEAKKQKIGGELIGEIY